MPERFTTKQNDSAPAIQSRLRDANRQVVNLTGASIKALMRVRPGGDVKVNGSAATIVGNASLGIVKYPLTSTDRDTPDIYEFEWEVTYSNGDIQTFPGNGYIIVDVQDDIG